MIRMFIGATAALACSLASPSITEAAIVGGSSRVCISGVNWGTGCFSSSRARSIANKAGYEYVSWSKCVGDDGVTINRCADIWANDASGLVRHRVSEASCGRASTCFGGHYSPMRVIYDNTDVFHGYSHWITNRAVYEVPGRGGWVSRFAYEAFNGRTQESRTAAAHLVHSWTLYDRYGDYVAGEVLTGTEIGTGAANEACDDRFGGVGKKSIAWNSVLSDVCSIVLPEFIEYSIDVKPEGVGFGVKSRWDVDFCDDAEDTTFKLLDAVYEHHRQACYENPAQYGIGGSGGQPVFEPIPELSNSNVAYNEDGTCNNFDDSIVLEWDTASGDHCWQELHVICGNDGKGGCTCEWAALDESVCTDA